jgi:hypothetical protein
VHTNKVTTFISSKLIQKNTYEQYVSAKDDDLYVIIENNDEYLLFFTHMVKYMQEVDPSIPNPNIKQFSNSLNKIIINFIKHNLVQVLPQFCRVHKRSCKFCHSFNYFNNQCKNKAPHQQQIDEYTYYPRYCKQFCHHFSFNTSHAYVDYPYSTWVYNPKQKSVIIELSLIPTKNVNTYISILNAYIS